MCIGIYHSITPRHPGRVFYSHLCVVVDVGPVESIAVALSGTVNTMDAVLNQLTVLQYGQHFKKIFTIMHEYESTEAVPNQVLDKLVVTLAAETGVCV